MAIVIRSLRYHFEKPEEGNFFKAYCEEKVCADLVRIWQSEKKTILFVTHDIEEAVQLADRVLVMSNRPATIQEVVDVDLPGRATLIRPVIWNHATASFVLWA
ncbi:MAG TPA: hypothetical protein VGZ24_11100 [Chthoniobacterales bacterium]|nr:hypothetical protein [Chthoniobacterales bacterium]